MPRYATIITGDDGHEVVSAIGEFEGAAPRPRLGRVEQVAPGVRIGMVRAGAGFCFPRPESGPVVGLVLARLEARARVAGRSVAQSTAPAKPKRARSGKAAKKKSRSKKPARSTPKVAPADCVGDAGATGRADG
ncbi:hypothetical protein [Mesorhizobium sp.]|jgi:hypothetical protein|uniref:hypothetical protein n=1 Tax=Mesorhizobium sp. TaxID=1871066 RepID=UPI00356698A2